MKKLLVLLAVLGMTAPLFAVTGERVDFGIAYDDATKGITISYQVVDTATGLPKTNGTNPVGIALRLNTDAVEGSANVDSSGTSGWVITNTAALLQVSSFFDIFLDYAYSQESATPGSYVLRSGHPLAKWIVTPGVDKGVAVLPASKVALCMAHLRASESATDWTGPASDDLVKIALTPGAGEMTFIVLNADENRGGVVGNDVLATNLPIEIGSNPCPGDEAYPYEKRADICDATGEYGPPDGWIGYDDLILVLAFYDITCDTAYPPQVDPDTNAFCHRADISDASGEYGPPDGLVGYDDLILVLAFYDTPVCNPQ